MNETKQSMKEMAKKKLGGTGFKPANKEKSKSMTSSCKGKYKLHNDNYEK